MNQPSRFGAERRLRTLWHRGASARGGPTRRSQPPAGVQRLGRRGGPRALADDGRDRHPCACHRVPPCARSGGGEMAMDQLGSGRGDCAVDLGLDRLHDLRLEGRQLRQDHGSLGGVIILHVLVASPELLCATVAGAEGLPVGLTQRSSKHRGRSHEYNENGAVAALLITTASMFPQSAQCPISSRGILPQQLHQRTSGRQHPDGCLPYCRRTGTKDNPTDIN